MITDDETGIADDSLRFAGGILFVPGGICEISAGCSSLASRSVGHLLIIFVFSACDDGHAIHGATCSVLCIVSDSESLYLNIWAGDCG